MSQPDPFLRGGTPTTSSITLPHMSPPALDATRDPDRTDSAISPTTLWIDAFTRTV